MASKEPYDFGSETERVIAFMACRSPKFWGASAQYIDLDRLEDPVAKLCLEAVTAIAVEHGRGPSNLLIVVQRLKRMYRDGKIKRSKMLAVVEMMSGVEDAGNLPNEKELAAEIAPAMQQDAIYELAKTAADVFAGKGDVDDVETLTRHVKKIGKGIDTSIGTRIGPRMVDNVVAMSRQDKLPTGILELDEYLGGGVPTGVTVYAGVDKGGKSMALNHTFAYNVLRGKTCLYATLENPQDEAEARFLAAVTDIQTNKVATKPKEVKRRMKMLMPIMGAAIIQSFPPGTLEVADLIEWMESCEAELGRKVDLLIIDYADKLKVNATKDGAKYAAMEGVYDRLHTEFEARKAYCLTASQVTRGKGRARIDFDDTADSKHKIRSATLAISLNRTEADKAADPEIMYFVMASRKTVSRAEIGPIPVDWSRARQTVEPLIDFDFNRDRY